MTSALKILVCGEGGVGKTSFLNRFLYDTFDENSKITKGVEFFNKNIQFHDDNYDLSLNLSLWDFSGQEHFRCIISDLVKGAKGAFLMFDLTRLSTLDRIDNWFETLGKSENIPILLLGSKEDLIRSEQWALIDEYAIRVVETHENCIAYLKISSKTGHNVKKAFHLLVNPIRYLNWIPNK